MNDLSNQQRRPDGKFGPAVVPKASADAVAAAAAAASMDGTVGFADLPDDVRSGLKAETIGTFREAAAWLADETGDESWRDWHSDVLEWSDDLSVGIVGSRAEIEEQVQAFTAFAESLGMTAEQIERTPINSNAHEFTFRASFVEDPDVFDQVTDNLGAGGGPDGQGVAGAFGTARLAFRIPINDEYIASSAGPYHKLKSDGVPVRTLPPLAAPVGVDSNETAAAHLNRHARNINWQADLDETMDTAPDELAVAFVGSNQRHVTGAVEDFYRKVSEQDGYGPNSFDVAVYGGDNNDGQVTVVRIPAPYSMNGSDFDAALDYSVTDRPVHTAFAGQY